MDYNELDTNALHIHLVELRRLAKMSEGHPWMELNYLSRIREIEEILSKRNDSSRSH